MDKMLLKSGYNLLHSGGFSFGEKNVLVLGDKGAGKTTTIVTALDEFNAAYISNDRMYVRNEKNKLHVIDREMGIKLASETIQHSSLRRHLPTSDFDPNSGKYYFNQIFRQIGAGRKAKAIATHMILPDIKNAQTGVYETDYNSNLLDKHVIVDCDGYNLYKLLLEAEQPEPIDFSKLNLKCLIAKGKEGIRAAISTIASE
jgi:translation initiation factor RLI1